MNIAVVTAMHGRPQVTAVFLAGLRRAGLPCYACVTHEDTENIELCEAHGVTFTTRSNEYVSDKFNAALFLVPRDVDGVMVLGSDDLVSHEWVTEARAALADGHRYLWPGRIAFYDPKRNRARSLLNDTGSVLKFGAGRVIARAVLDALAWQLWPMGLTRGLDQASHSYVRGTKTKIWRSTSPDVAVVDIKTGGNLHPFERWNGMEIDPELALAMCGDEELILMEELR